MDIWSGMAVESVAHPKIRQLLGPYWPPWHTESTWLRLIFLENNYSDPKPSQYVSPLWNHPQLSRWNRLFFAHCLHIFWKYLHHVGFLFLFFFFQLELEPSGNRHITKVATTKSLQKIVQVAAISILEWFPCFCYLARITAKLYPKKSLLFVNWVYVKSARPRIYHQDWKMKRAPRD